MASEWRDAAWGDLATLEYGGLSKHDYSDVGPHPAYGTNGPVGRTHIIECGGPGVVVGRKGAYRGVHYSARPFGVIGTAFYLKPTCEFDMKWAYYQLLTVDINGRDSGSAIPSTSRYEFYAVPVAVPPLPEQRAIAHILGTLDDKIDLNRRMNETLEAMARALFKSWFVDFDPVRAKAEGRDPGLPKPLADLFSGSFEDSGLGEIPKGWEVASLEDYATLNPESWTRQTRPTVIRYVDLSNTKWGRLGEVAECDSDAAPSRAQRVLRAGDTIVGTVRPGNGSYALVSEPGLTGSTGFAVLRPRSEWMISIVYLAATQGENIDTLAHLADGGAYPAVRPEAVLATQIVVPPAQLGEAIGALVGPMLSTVAARERESRTLAALRDALLPKLISGEIRIKDAERFLSEAGV